MTLKLIPTVAFVGDEVIKTSRLIAPFLPILISVFWHPRLGQ